MNKQARNNIRPSFSSYQKEDIEALARYLRTGARNAIYIAVRDKLQQMRDNERKILSARTVTPSQ